MKPILNPKQIEELKKIELKKKQEKEKNELEKTIQFVASQLNIRLRESIISALNKTG